ncbi:outer membrane protein transport protein [Endozoicomonas sp. Mp262]|uniref:OmpP1/FadL family transporter n=1 Tax=Endozoicomonas sp. Mp262 TaxID=2919499 RepID=UPI0021D9CD3D
MKISTFTLSTLAISIANTAVASGFEGVTQWNAKHGALGGTGASYVNDSSSIFFNPAGLAFTEHNDIALHIAIFDMDKDVPVAAADSQHTNDIKHPYRGGFTGNYRLDDQWVLGYGIFNVGGTNQVYKDITVGQNNNTLTDDFSSYLNIMEANLSLGYKIDKNWSVGAGLRYTWFASELQSLASVQSSPTMISGLRSEYKELTGHHFGGVRLGIMYRADDNQWGAGFSYRSKVKTDQEGKHHMRVNTPVVSEYRDQNVKTESILPEQFSVGVDYRITPDLQLFGEYTFTRYSDIEKIEFVPDNLAVAEIATINTDWKDRHTYKIGSEYSGSSWPVRTGYSYTTQVVPDERATSTFSIPAPLHIASIGTGKTFFDNALVLDMTIGYAWYETKNLDNNSTLKGSYSEKTLWVMASTKYLF